MPIVNNVGSGTERFARKMTPLQNKEYTMATKPSMAGQGLGLLGTFINGVRSILESTYGKTVHKLERLADPRLHQIVAAYLAGLPITIEEAKQSSTQPTTHNLKHTIWIAMDLRATIAQLITKGEYGGVDRRSVESFNVIPGAGIRRTQIHLLHYNKDMSSDTVLTDMKHRKMRAATFRELLWIGIQHGSIQREFPIIALGTIAYFNNDHIVGCLTFFDNKRILRCHSSTRGTWYDECRFAAVRLPAQICEQAA